MLPLWRALEPGQIREKGPGDLVTEADLRSEAWLTERLADLVPGSLVVGEEAVAKDPDILDRLSGDGPVWVIDPVDGTANFAKGLATFAIIVARVQGGETVQGWICEPAAGHMAVGERGGGVEVDGARLTTQTLPKPGSRLSGYSAGRWRSGIAKDPERFGNVAPSSSAGHEYLELLTGSVDFTAYSRLKPWDHAAGALMVQEAGGISQLLNRERYSPRFREGHLLSTMKPENWSALRDIFTDGLACT